MPENPYDTPDVLAINLCILLGVDPNEVYEGGVTIDWELEKITLARIGVDPVTNEFIRGYSIHPFPEGFSR